MNNSKEFYADGSRKDIDDESIEYIISNAFGLDLTKFQKKNKYNTSKDKTKTTKI